MSGDERVHLPGAALASLVRALARLAGAELGSFAVIGGVAVTARLGRAHRATADIDTVVDDDRPPPALDVLRDLDGVVPDAERTHRVYLDGTKVEVIATNAISESDVDGLDDRQTLFVASHRWALETATPLTVSGEGGTRATVPFARPSALVAMKLHAIQDRRAGGGLDKRAGDAWDLYRMLTDLDVTTIAADLELALPSLRRVVTAAAREILVDRAGRTTGWLRSGDAAMGTLAVEDLVAAGSDLLGRIE